jgi:hypothetical protein
MLWHLAVRDRENLWLSANQAELKGMSQCSDHVTLMKRLHKRETYPSLVSIFYEIF